MKKICLTITIAVLLLICSNAIQAQTTQTKLNQVELMKQFLGTWKSEMVQDTIWTGEGKSFGNGMELYFKGETKGKIVSEMKSLIGYDKKNDKLIEADLMNSSDIMVYAFWFNLKNKCIEIPYEYIANPEKAPLKWDIEFKSPDLFIQTLTENNKIVQVMTFKREKM
jgi:hypothetical protein